MRSFGIRSFLLHGGSGAPVIRSTVDCCRFRHDFLLRALNHIGAGTRDMDDARSQRRCENAAMARMVHRDLAILNPLEMGRYWSLRNRCRRAALCPHSPDAHGDLPDD